MGHTIARCWYRKDEFYQDEPPPATLAATSSSKIDPNWYSDTGATDQITSNLDRLAVHECYHGGEQVQVGNGAGLRILHTGHSLINTAACSLALRNIWHVPESFKHLLSVHKFSCDNDVFFKYHSWHFSIKDRRLRKSFLDGRCKSGLKPSDADGLKHALVSRSTTHARWHCTSWTSFVSSSKVNFASQ